MQNLKELLRQKAELDKAIELAVKQVKLESVAKVQALMVELGVSVSDLRDGPALRVKKESSRLKVAAKYRDEVTGESWSGRGLQPKWMKSAIQSGRKIEDFAIKAE